jgi:alpha-L-fucosidase
MPSNEPAVAPIRGTSGNSSWFVHDRFGLFIHWGLYALPARGEWVKSVERITDADYQKYFQAFEPDLYDPALWADAAVAAGMKYFVITAKHHEGFCLWDSKVTQYKATVAPNCRRDLLRPMAEAFRARGLKTGFYYSVIDWHHPHYWVDNRNHPQRAFVSGDGAGPEPVLNRGIDMLERMQAAGSPDPNIGRDQATYTRYLHEQVRELLTDYGPVDLMWFDFSFPALEGFSRLNFAVGKGREAWQSEKLLQMIRQLRPEVLLGNRLDLPDEPGNWDFATPEQSQPRGWVEVGGHRVVWEACQTFSGSWGYNRDEASFRSTNELIQCLIDCVSKGGNLLLNVGPTGRGEFDSRALERLRGIGRWMKLHSRSIYGCTEAPPEFKCPQDCRLTYNAEKKRLYVHLFAYPYKHLHLDGQAYRNCVEYGQLLHDASETKLGLDAWHATQIGADETSLVVNLPQLRPDVAVPVIELYLK